ncbi:hypothetical protein ACSBLW_12430 [Thioclava sp. FR2]|uniref:hypothetical protein n=1 Tax=Thioclava sp. FR2 TaxID=3445780 RepID=UPI003EB6E9E8
MDAKRKKLNDLARIATLVRDTELHKLANASRPLLEIRLQIAALSEVDCGAQVDISATRTAAKHDQWRFQKRIELNGTLAHKTAIYLAQHDIAARAFGRAATLERIGRK